MALAIECDGASYHSSATARDRDRLRQEHLERLGWSFHRIWSTDWFRNREAEVERAVAAWKDATAAATGRKANPEYGPRDSSPSNQAPSTTHPPASAREAGGRARGKRPSVPRSMPIGQHSQRDLVALIRWIESDTLLRTEDELLAAAMQELGYKKRGPRIIDALTEAIQTARRR